MSVFENDPALIAITEDIKNCGEGVANCIAPNTQVPSCTYKFAKFDNSDYYKIPQAKLAGCAYPNEIDCVTFEYEERKTQQYFLDKYICQRDLDCFNANPCNTVQFDWVAKQSRHLMNKLLLSHERDVVTSAFDVTKYTALTPAQIEDATIINGSCVDITAQPWDPTSSLLEYLMCLIEKTSPRMTHMVVSRSVMNAIRRHPDFLGAGCVISNLTDVDSVRDLLGLQQICVSDNYFDAAPFGAPRDLQRFISDQILLFHRSNAFDGPDCGEANFAWTAQWGQTFAGRIACPKRGGRGGFYLRSGWDKDLYVNHELGLLIKGVEAKQP